MFFGCLIWGFWVCCVYFGCFEGFGGFWDLGGELWRFVLGLLLGILFNLMLVGCSMGPAGHLKKTVSAL